ncbi:MAG: beta-N-acetylhexosaminidase [Eubacteriales bacterium]
MKGLNIIPYPNSVEYLGEDISVENIDIRLSSQTITDKIADPEGYELSISEWGIKILAGGEPGAFYAKQTLKQLAATGEGTLPCATIRDEPAYAYRGFMLDSVRHMTALDDIKKMIDAAALLKFNVFHWHLTDDQGWRIEIESHPRLNEIGSTRASSDFGKVHTNKEYGGDYTKRELKEIVDYCAKRFIDVIPEIDMPGHMIAAIASYPGVSCTGEQIPVETRQGVFPDILCAGKDETFELVFDVLSEILDIFPSKYIHIGGDEAPKKRWAECPDCQRRISELGLNDEEELQGWFVNRIADYLRQNGRKTIAWNESLKSGLLNDDILVQMWMDKKKLSVDYANNGGKLIISPYFYYYTDYPYGMTPLNKTYKFNPLLKGINEDDFNNVVGVEVPIWTEHVRDFKHMSYMIYPRFAAVAETGWTKPEIKDAKDFTARMERFVPQLEAIGITPADPPEWNPNPLQRVIQTVKFFSGNLTKDMIKGYE